MKFPLASLAVFFISNLCFSQIAVVSCEKMNVAIKGVDNPLSIAVENVPAKFLVVKATSGTVTRVADGKYIYKGSEFGIDDILIYRKDNGHLKQVGSVPLRVDSFPDPVLLVGGGHGSMRSRLTFPQAGLIARFEDTDFEAPVRIVSYTVSIIRNDSCQSKTFSNLGNRFNEQVVLAFRELRTNDLVIFKDVIVSLPDGTSREIRPLLVTIAE